MGYSGGEFDVTNVNVKFSSEADGESDELVLMVDGAPTGFDEVAAKRLLLRKKIDIDIVLKDGTAKATAWGCDLTYDYVKINGDYRS
jgi:glutamate N-acetyltransferase/amino-acid N-acetyltransferase